VCKDNSWIHGKCRQRFLSNVYKRFFCTFSTFFYVFNVFFIIFNSTFITSMKTWNSITMHSDVATARISYKCFITGKCAQDCNVTALDWTNNRFQFSANPTNLPVCVRFVLSTKNIFKRRKEVDRCTDIKIIIHFAIIHMIIQHNGP